MSGRIQKNDENAPVTKKPDTPKPHPLETQNVLISALFNWCTGAIKISSSKDSTWTQDMNFDLPEVDKVGPHKSRLTANYDRRSNLLWNIILAYPLETLVLFVAQIAITVLGNLGATVNASALAEISTVPLYQNQDNLIKVGTKLIAGVLISMFSSLLDAYFIFYSMRLSLKVKSSLFSVMQDKIMRFSVLNSPGISQGFITDLIQVDVVYLYDLYYKIYQMVGSIMGTPTSILFFLYYLGFNQMGLYLVAYLFTFVSYFICYCLQVYYTRKYLEAKDRRMSLLRNVLDNTDFIKINALENYFCLEMYEKREDEIYWLTLLGILFSFKLGVEDICGDWFLTIFFRLFWIYTSGIGMDLEKFFKFQSYSTNLQTSLTGLVTGYSDYLKVMVSIRRLDRFLRAPEVYNKEKRLSEGGLNDGNAGQENDDTAIKIHNGAFKWNYSDPSLDENSKKSLKKGRRGQKKSLRSSTFDSETISLGITSSNKTTAKSLKDEGDLETQIESLGGQFMLKNVTIDIKKGQKVAVIGGSSSGMSSLLYAMIEEMIPVRPSKVIRNGSVAFLDQSRWLMGCSIKENITLGKEYNAERMRLTLEASELKSDLDLLTDGLKTIISDDASSISGGQKARIALARCFYQE